MKKVALVVGVMVLLVWCLRPAGFVELGPGVKAAEAPVQKDVERAERIEFGDYSLTPQAEFSLEARVLSSKRYRGGHAAELAPYDLALGWKEMSDEAVISELSISQSGRIYRWHARKMPVARSKIEKNSANMHLIPADDEVRQAIARARAGDLAVLVGKLVDVASDRAFTWKTSMTRDDTGNGACEVVYVERFAVITQK